MTAVASPPSFQQLNRPGWNVNGGQSLNSMNPEDVRGMFVPRKTLQRSNSSSSVASTSSNSSTTTVATNASQPNGTPASTNSDMSSWSSTASRKRPQPKGPWPPGKPEGQPDFGRPVMRSPMNGINGNSSLQTVPGQPQMMPQQGLAARPVGDPMPSGQPVLYLLSLNGTFERKTISVPYYPESLRIGRQTNQKTIPTATNGYFDSKVLSRQHAEVWADRMGKIYIRDVKSSNGTFVNGTRLSQENRESEPHELQTGDHVELGIDIVSEDQKTVVHHKVAAKVEHAGFVSPSNNVMDMNFGDLDPANGAMAVPASGPMPYRGRTGSNASMASNGRMIAPQNMAGMVPNGGAARGFLLTPITTEHIVKRLHNEMRSARLQSQDLSRTGHFIHALLGKEEVKDLEKPEAHEPPRHLPNGNALPFRTDAKTRFSDPPAPPPQQPLPEKPDVPSLKRGTTERPKANSTPSPVGRDNLHQIIQLTEALNNAKKEMDTQTARIKDLEDMLTKEREARELAEDMAKILEDSAVKETNGGPKEHDDTETILEDAFEPPQDDFETRDVEMTDAEPIAEEPTPESAEDIAARFQAKIDTMMSEMSDLKQQMDAWKQRCEQAETERDADRKTLAEMVARIRRDEEAKQAAATAEPNRSPSRGRRGRSGGPAEKITTVVQTDGSGESTPAPTQTEASVYDPSDKPTLSRANTITPLTIPPGKLAKDQAMMASVPYASMLGVVIIGMGLMAYINGWQPEPTPRH
ncbi:FHA domain-containing protein [Colletotrichum higginsianum]|uniref:FHA domain-containing protein n=1 Tax=Colletotrichum higginsianum (strain IMI 349063) TaxID=759273 RepID=H1V1R0_COLHI|nr:FHA domain-containing protein [Colletotrichum higginsianum IMI 349063]OBR08345.1 FHA domain-containing protein [Colletotrichum higginsianum IMI 349063]CCF34162.1 FHA domain-containing protein [Colletotrichum higginsianum]